MHNIIQIYTKGSSKLLELFTWYIRVVADDLSESIRICELARVRRACLSLGQDTSTLVAQLRCQLYLAADSARYNCISFWSLCGYTLHLFSLTDSPSIRPAGCLSGYQHLQFFMRLPPTTLRGKCGLCAGRMRLRCEQFGVFVLWSCFH